MNISELKDLDFNNIGDWPQAAKTIAIALVALIIIITGYWLVTRFQVEQLSTLQNKENELKQSYETKASRAANLDAYKLQMEEVRKNFRLMVRQLPNKNEVASLLDDITQTGINSGLEFELFKPQPEIPAEFYAELPVKIRVRGTYHQFGEFASGISGLSRIVTLHDFAVKQDERKASSRLLMEVTAKTYRYMDEAELAARATAQAAKNPPKR
ncbi:MAG: type 4a pilus biogenesis protein PilO [Pseudomonadota bacterium]